MNKWEAQYVLAQYVLLCGIAVEIFIAVVLFSALFGLVVAVPCGLLLIALVLNFDCKSRVAIFDWVGEIRNDFDYNHLRISNPPPSYKDSLLAKISAQRDICTTALNEANRQCEVAKEASLEIMRLEEMLKSVEMVDGVCGLHPTGKDLVVVKKE